MKSISILGCGWYGAALGISLIKQGYIIKGSTTKKARMSELMAKGILPYLIKIDAHLNPLSFREFFNCEILIISCNIKLSSMEYVASLQNLTHYLEQNFTKVIFISSTSLYRDSNQIINELSEPQPKTIAGKILLEAEDVFVKNPNISTTIIRFGGLIGPGRMPGRFFSGKTGIPNGMAPVNMIHLKDCIGITKAVIENGVADMIINAVSPHHPTKASFYKKAVLMEGLPLPHFMMELNQWKIVSSHVLDTQFNYIFQVDNLLDWLQVI